MWRIKTEKALRHLRAPADKGHKQSREMHLGRKINHQHVPFDGVNCRERSPNSLQSQIPKSPVEIRILRDVVRCGCDIISRINQVANSLLFVNALLDFLKLGIFQKFCRLFRFWCRFLEIFSKCKCESGCVFKLPSPLVP